MCHKYFLTFITTFQECINKTCCSKRDNFISEDTMETASYLYVKIVYNIVYDTLESPRLK